MEQFRGRKDLLRPVTAWLVVVAAAVLSAVALTTIADPATRNVEDATLPDGAESTRALQARQQLPAADVSPAIAVFHRDGDRLTDADRRAVGARVARLGELAAQGERTFPVFARDGEAALVGVPLPADLPESEVRAAVDDVRATAAEDLPDGLQVEVTGGPAFEADLSSVFDGADTRLLLTTATVVALLLLLTYRSPWLWLVPLTVVGTADRVTTKLVSLASGAFGFSVDESTIGITSVLVFGAGTNYALLLIARYREELRAHESRYVAMRTAVRRAGPAILASSSTVALALLSLGVAVTPANRGLGFAAAIGIGTAVLYALVALPAALVVCGRWLFWPFVPRPGQDDPTRAGFWWRVGRVVTARPVTVTTVSVLLLGALALGGLGIRTGLAQTELFRETPESVTGQEVLAEHFPAGSSQPTTVITSPVLADEVSTAVRDVEGVDSVRPGGRNDELVQLDLVLSAAPESERSGEIVQGVREAVHDVDAAAMVGGADAQALDARQAAERDRLLIVPIILGIVLVVLLLLLRSVVAALVLVTTVVATYAASMGAGWFAFERWFGFPAMDLSVPLFSFLFLVALGVDYNIFLATRAREEATEHDARTSIRTALAVTGGVITSAGILLAAVFTTLGVLPFITLTQIGVIVGFGVLLDTLLVRSVLVPALVSLIGERFWWPGNPTKGRHA